jgi:hypothetical protein
LAKCFVKRGQFSQQNSEQRHTITDDLVHSDEEPRFLLGKFHQTKAHQRLTLKIKPALRVLFAQANRLSVPKGQRKIAQIVRWYLDRTTRPDDLTRFIVYHVKVRSPDFVPPDYLR